MPDIWQQFHSLPKAIKDGVASPQAIAAVDDLEAHHPGVDLANLIMRVVVHEVPVADMSAKLQAESGVDAATAAIIVDRLRREVFTGVVAEYLGISVIQDVPPVSETVPTPPVIQPLPPRQPVQPAVDAPVSVPVVLIQPSASLPVLPVAVPPLPSVPMQAPSSPVGMLAPTTHYSEDDAVEIEQQAARLKTMSAINPNQDLEAVAQSILTGENLAFGDELMQRRATTIIKSRLKDIRTTDVTIDMLTRDVKVGGLGLDREIASAVATTAERYATQLKSRGMIETPQTPVMPQPPAIPKIEQAKPVPMPLLRRDAPSVPAAPIPNVTEAARPSRPIVRPDDIPTPPTPRPSLGSFMN